MSRRRWLLLVVVCLVPLALGFFLGGWMLRLVAAPGTKPARNAAAILRQVQTLSHLVTVKYVLEKVVILEDVRWYGESRVLMVAHGVVKAGVDLSRLGPKDLQLAGHKVKITLPKAAITDVYLDEQKTQVIERTTGLLRTFDKDLEQNARRQAIADIRRSAIDNDILHDAQERARQQLINLFLQMGYEEVEVATR